MKVADLEELVRQICGGAFGGVVLLPDSDGGMAWHVHLSSEVPGIEERLAALTPYLGATASKIRVHMPLKPTLQGDAWRVEYSRNTECFFVIYTKANGEELPSLVPRDELLEAIPKGQAAVDQAVFPPWQKAKARTDGFEEIWSMQRVLDLVTLLRQGEQQLRAASQAA